MLLFLYSKLCKILFFTLLAVFIFNLYLKIILINYLIIYYNLIFPTKKLFFYYQKNIMSEANYNYLFKFIIIGDTCKIKLN